MTTPDVLLRTDTGDVVLTVTEPGNGATTCLTPTEARTVAAALLAHADHLDSPAPTCRHCDNGVPHRHTP